jgi:peptidoglycan glycosyltransferase
VWKTPLGERNAQILTDLMVQVSVVGTARCCIALANGVPVASKTGTAQLNEPGEPERSHAWITAFAPADNPRFVVAVILKGTSAEISAGTGGQLAGPLAKRMLDAALRTDETR